MSARGRTDGPAAGTPPKRVAVYTRKSTSAGLEQDFNSLDAQREACDNYARSQAHLGWKLVAEKYDDGGFTGANLERPAFQRLLADIDAGRIDVVVVYKVDRLSRSLLDFARVMERFNRAGVAFVSVTQNFSTADAMGRLTLNMLMSFAEFEREMIAERTRDKVAAARRRGKWTGGPVPLGYDVKEKKLVVNELEAVLVREVFALYLANRSTLAVARELNARKHTTKHHRTGSGRIQGGRRWKKGDVLRTLRNPVYAGLMGCGSEVHQGEHPAIVDRETFAKARELLEENRCMRKDHGRNAEYFLRGIIFCQCGAAFTPGSTRRGEREYRYYRCVTRDKEGKEACPAAPLPAGAIEEYVVERVREAIGNGGFADEVAATAEARIDAKRAALAVARKELPGKIAALSADGRALVDGTRGVEGRARALLDERLKEVGEQLARAEARLAEVQRETAALDAVEVETGWVVRCLAEFTAIWDVLTPLNRGRLVRSIIERIEVDEPANRITVAFAPLGGGDPMRGDKEAA